MRLFRLAGLFVVLAIAPARAQVSVWDSAILTGNWSDPANWGGVAPISSATTSLTFAGAGTGVYTATNDFAAPFVLTQLAVNHAGTGGSFTVAGAQLQFTTASGTGNALLLVQGNQPVFVSAAIDTVRPLQISRSGAGVGGGVTFSGLLTGTGGLVGNYAGTTSLTGGATAFGQIGLFRGSTSIAGGVSYGVTGSFLTGGLAGVSTTALVTGTGTSVTANFVDVSNGANAIGVLEIRSGASVTATGAVGQVGVGYSAGGDGRILVSGAGSALSAGGFSAVGIAGTGLLTVEAGATSTLTGGLSLGESATGIGALRIDAGSMTVGTAPTRGLSVGRAGAGTLDVRAGGQLTVGDPANIGATVNTLFFAQSGGTGTGTVSGTGSTINATNLAMNGSSTLTVDAGGTLTVRNLATIGQNAAAGVGSLILDGAGTTLSMNGNGSVGQQAQLVVGVLNGSAGSMTVRNGASATVGTAVNGVSGLTVARDVGSTGTLLVTGTGSALSTPVLQVGGQSDTSGNATPGGNASVTVSNGGLVSVINSLPVYAGGTVTANSGGTVRIGAAGGVSGNINVNDGGRFGGTGTAIGSVVVAPGGLMTPGNSPGTNTIGTFTIDGPTQFLAPAGTTRSTYGWEIAAAGSPSATPGGSGGTKDLLVVRNGSLSLDGVRLAVNEQSGFGGTFDPAQQYSWILMRVEGLTNGLTVTGAGAVEVSPGALSNAMATGGTLSLSIGADANNRYLLLSYAPVPEPAGLLVALAAGFAWSAWRRNIGHGQRTKGSTNGKTVA